MDRAHKGSEYISQNLIDNSPNTLATINAALTEIALKKGAIKIEWACALRNRYGNKWLLNCADKLDPEFLSGIKDQSFLS